MGTFFLLSLFGDAWNHLHPALSLYLTDWCVLHYTVVLLAPSMETYLNKKFSGASSSEWLSEGVASFQQPRCLKKLVWLEVKSVFYWRGGSKIVWTLTPTQHVWVSELSLMVSWRNGGRVGTAFASSERVVEMVSVFLFHSDLMPAWRLSEGIPDLLSFW